MLRTLFSSLLAMLAFGAAASAQSAPWRYHWQTGQVLVYKVEQTTAAKETVAESTEETKTRLNLTKRWQVVNVDSAGVATLQLSLAALRSETIRPGGDVILFDSIKTDNAPELQAAFSKYLGQVLVVLRIDAAGRVVEVKESKHGPASLYEANPPFALVLPGAAVRPGQGWDRNYTITLEPPQGTGEKYQASQRYVCKEATANNAVFELSTTLKTQPDALADRVPLLQFLPEGEIVFDTQSGLVRSVRLTISKELKGHQGEGSSYAFQSAYKEEYVGIK